MITDKLLSRNFILAKIKKKQGQMDKKILKSSCVHEALY